LTGEALDPSLLSSRLSRNCQVVAAFCGAAQQSLAALLSTDRFAIDLSLHVKLMTSVSALMPRHNLHHMLNFMKRERNPQTNTSQPTGRTTPKNKNPDNPNYYTGISFEPEVIAYLDDLAVRMRMNRSWVINTIIHEYAKIVENKHLIPLSSRENIIRL
jgi:hypothetical protein